MESTFVICVSGVVGSGKTSLVRGLARQMSGIAVLSFDAYQQVCRWFPGVQGGVLGWLQTSADLDDYVDASAFLADLRTLMAGKMITMPLAPDHETTDLRVEPARVLIVESQFGRALKGMIGLVDFAIHVNTPLDVALCRTINRAESMGEETMGFASRYLSRHGHLFNERMQRVSETADLVLNGVQDIQMLVAQAMEALRRIPNQALQATLTSAPEG